MANGIQVLPTLDRFAGLRQGSQNLVGNFLQARQQQEALQRQQQQQRALQQLGGQFGLNLPQGLSPQLGNLLVAQQQKASLDPGSAASGFTLGQGQQRFDAQGKPIASVDPAQPTPQAPSAFQEKQARIEELSAIENPTPIQQAELNTLVGAGQPKSEDEAELLKSQIDKNRAEANRLQREGGGELTGEQKLAQGNTLRKEFNSLSKNFMTIRDSNERLKAAAADPSAAGDLAVIFNFMKILDPGSVVRESEFATAENAASVPVAIRNMWNKALSGERISVNRGDFVKQAENLFKAQQRTQSKLVDRYTGLSNRFGIDPENVIAEIVGASQPQADVPQVIAPVDMTPEQRRSRIVELKSRRGE